MRKTRTAVAGLVVFSCLLVQATGAKGFAVCFGEDGHIALEDTRLGICNHTLDQLAETTPPSSRSLAIDSPQVTCCPCFDISLPGPPLDRIRPPAEQALPQGEALPRAGAPEGFDAVRVPGGSRLFLLPPPLIALRVVVLLV